MGCAGRFRLGLDFARLCQPQATCGEFSASTRTPKRAGDYFFGETVIDIVPYFHAAKFEIGTLPVIVILFAMFTVYVMQFSYFIDEHKAQNSGALPSYSHYAVLIGIALATVALAWLHQNSTATAESARMLWLGLGVFYLGVAANTPHNKPEHRHPQRLWIFQTTLFVIGAELAAVLPP